MMVCDVDKGYGVEDNLVLVIVYGSFEWWCVMLTKVMVLKIVWFWSLVMVVLGVDVMMCDVGMVCIVGDGTCWWCVMIRFVGVEDSSQQ